MVLIHPPVLGSAGANLNGTLPQNLFSGLPDLQQLNVESNPSKLDLPLQHKLANPVRPSQKAAVQ